MTSPPCEEYVIRFVVDKVIEISTTLVTMIREGLEYDEDTKVPKLE